MARDEYRGWRDDDQDRRDRQQNANHDNERWQQDQQRYGRGQQRGERFGGDFRADESSHAPGQSDGWQSDDEFGQRGDLSRSRGGYPSGSQSGSSGSYGSRRSWEDDNRFSRSGYGDTSRGTASRRDYGRSDRDRDWDRSSSYRAGSSGSLGGFDRDYGGRSYGGGERGYSEGGRDFWDKASDEVSSWFGDRDAERRRRMDQHRGRGPKNYSRSDERIREDVNDRLTDDDHIDASDIEVAVSSREVTLSGIVDSRFAKRHAEDIAESVSGVSHVQNNLRVRDRVATDTPGLTSANGDLTGSTNTSAESGSLAGATTTRRTSGI